MKKATKKTAAKFHQRSGKVTPSALQEVVNQLNALVADAKTVKDLMSESGVEFVEIDGGQLAIRGCGDIESYLSKTKAKLKKAALIRATAGE